VSTGTGTIELRLDAGPTVRAGASGATVGERAHAVVRPEKLQLHGLNGADPAAGRAHVDGQVESSLYLGTATQVTVRLPDDTRMTVLVPNTDEEARSRLPAAGDSARLTWSDSNIHMVTEAAAAKAADDEEGTAQ
jgi:ABC-type Fe3+/spermidine/putrescine transport system ATPase subunit